MIIGADRPEKGQSETMKLGGSKIFVITAGMMSENTAAHDLAVRMVEMNAINLLCGICGSRLSGGKIEKGGAG